MALAKRENRETFDRSDSGDPDVDLAYAGVKRVITWAFVLEPICR